MNYSKKLILIGISAMTIVSCSKLDEKLNSQLTEAEVGGSGGGGSADVAALLSSAYISLYAPYGNQEEMFALAQHPTDETIGPTRGPDWDDGGTWRVLHSHKWDANHPYIANAFRNVLKTSFTTTDLLRFNPSAQQAAEARFLRAFTNFLILDGWDQVPYREDTDNPNEVPKVRKGMQALDYIIAELNEILPNLPDNGPAFQATKKCGSCIVDEGLFK